MTKPEGKSEPGVLECARHSDDLTATFLEMAGAFSPNSPNSSKKAAVQRRASPSGVDSARSEHRERRRAHQAYSVLCRLPCGHLRIGDRCKDNDGPTKDKSHRSVN